MPKAHVLQAFFELIACQNRQGPTFQAIRRLYQIAGQPPPLVTRRMTHFSAAML
jgi:hypothetical protein